MIWILDLLLQSHRFLKLCSFFFSVSFLLFLLSKFSWCVLKFNHFIFGYHYYCALPLLSLGFLFFQFSREFVITFRSSSMIAALKFLSDNFNIWIISVLLSVGSLFSLKLWFSWSLVWPVIFSCALDSLNILLGDSWPFKNLDSRQPI